MNSLPGKFKCSAFEWFSCPEGITPNSGLTGPNTTTIYIYIYIYIYIIIIMSCRQHGYPWLSLSPLLPIIHRLWQVFRVTSCVLTYVCKFELVVLLLLGHMWGSLGVHDLWARPCFSSSVPACLVRLTCIVFVMGGKWPYSWCLVGCCRQDLFNIALNILV